MESSSFRVLGCVPAVREILVMIGESRYTAGEEVMQTDLGAIAKKHGLALVLQFGSSVTAKHTPGAMWTSLSC
jgi:hypothetical protein